MKSKLLVAIAFFASSALLLGACSNIDAAIASRPTTAKIGDPAPEIDLKSMTGDQIVLSQLQGHPVLVNFWATWCGPCREEFPALVRAFKKYKDHGFVVIGVNFQDENSDQGVLTFMQNTLVNFPVVRDVGDRVGRTYRVEGLPTSYFIDRSGVIRDEVVGGPLTDDALDRLFAEISP